MTRFHLVSLALVALTALAPRPALAAGSTRGLSRVTTPDPVTPRQAARGRVDAIRAATSELMVESSAPKGFRSKNGDSALRRFEAGAGQVYAGGGDGAIRKLGADIETRLKKRYGQDSAFRMGAPKPGDDGRTTSTFFQQIQQKNGQNRFVQGSVDLVKGPKLP